MTGGSSSDGRLPLALTMGDPAGIGPELAIIAWSARHRSQIPAFAFYGDAALVGARAKSIGQPIDVREVRDARDAHGAFADALPVVDVPLACDARAGQPDAANGQSVIAAIDRAVADVAAGRAAAVVTSPIAKSVLYSAGFTHPGHTEYLGALASRFWPGNDEPPTPVMMLASDLLRVVPLTIHVPLKDVAGMVTPERIMTTARIVAAALKQDFDISEPRIAICGLNPHAGEGGAIGREDRDLIAPAIDQLAREGLRVTGPHSADTLFHAAARKRYDAVIAMYHDQALIPIKTLSFDTGVNVTLGLPFVRTSPDHGTAFDIAGKGTASPASLIAALKLAADMAARRSRARHS